MAITLSDSLQITLYLAGAAALIYLALVLKNVFKITGKVKNVLEEDEVAINGTVKKLPSISNNADKASADAASITEEVNGLVTNIRPGVGKLSGTIDKVTDTIDSLAGRVDTASLQVQNALTDISGSISDTAKTISVNVNNVIDYFYILRKVIEALKDVFLE